MEMKLLDRAALLLWPDTPNAGLSGITGRPKPTARTWRSARRRAPARVLSLVRTELQSRGSEIFSLIREFDLEIARREGEPPPRRGFMEIREHDSPGSIPRDGRNRRGRPRRALGVE
jgi:hypothetical protein